MTSRILLRRGTAAQWASANPILGSGELGVETDTLKFKIGNGTSTWTQLTSYANITPSDLTSAINGLINAAPSALDTLNELAAAINNDSSFSTTVNNLLNGKVSKSGGDTITSATTSTIGLIIKAITSQTANILEIQNPTAGVIFAVTPTAEVISYRKFSVFAPSASTTGLIVKGAASQTANLQEWQNNAGTALTTIDNNAGFYAQYIEAKNTAGVLVSGESQIKIASPDGLKDIRFWNRNDAGGLYYYNSSGGSKNILRIAHSTDPRVVTQTWQDFTSSNSANYGGRVNIDTSITTVIGMVIRGVVSQTANLTEWQDSSGTILSKITASGVFGTNVIVNAQGTAPRITLNDASSTVLITAATASTVGTVIKGAASQTANLTEWQNNAGTILSKIDVSGNITAPSYNLSDSKYLLRKTIKKTVDPAGNAIANNTYDLFDMNFSSSLQGTFYIQASIRGSGYGQNLTYSLPATYVMDWINLYPITNPFTNSTTWVDLTPLTFSPRHLMTNDYFKFQAKVNNNQISFRIKLTGTLTGSPLFDIYIQHSEEFANSIITELNTTGTDATTSNVMPNFLSSRAGLSAIFNPISLYSNSANNIPLTVKGFTSQSANLQEWQDSSGTILTKIMSNGSLFVNSTGTANDPITIQRASATRFKVDPYGNVFAVALTAGNVVSSIAGTTAGIYTTSASTIGLVVKGSVSQTADLQQWWDSSSNVLSKIDSSGAIYLINPTANNNSNDTPSPAINFQGNIWNSAYGNQNIKGAIKVAAYATNANPTISKMSFLLATDNGTPAEVASFTNTGAFSNIGGLDAYGSSVIFRLRNTTAPANSESFSPSPKLELMGRGWNSNQGASPSRAYLQVNVNNTNSDPFINRLGFFIATGNDAGGYVYGADATEYLSILGNGTVGINTTIPLGTLDIRPISASNKGIVIKGATSQTANLQEWQNSSGTVLAKIAADGSTTFASPIVGFVGNSGSYSSTAVSGYNIIHLSQGMILINSQTGGDYNLATNAYYNSGWKYFESAGSTLINFGNGRFDFNTASSGTAGNAITYTSKMIIANSGTVTINGFGAAAQGLIVKGAASQSANLTEWQNSSGTVLASINSSGYINSSGGIKASSHGYIYTSSTQGSVSFMIADGNAAYVPLVIKGAASQTADLQQWQNSAGEVQVSIKPTSNLTNVLKFTEQYSFAINWGNSPILSTTSGYLTTTPYDASRTSLIVKGLASQTGDLQQWQNSAGTVLVKVAADGVVTAGNLITNIFSTQSFGTGSLSFSGIAYNGFSNPSGVTTLPTLVIKGIASQTADLQQWQRNDGFVLLKVSSSGDVTAGSGSSTAIRFRYFDGINITGTYWDTVETNSATFIGRSTTATTMVVRGAASQTANLQEWQNSAGTVLGRVDNYGALYLSETVQIGPGTTDQRIAGGGLTIIHRGGTSSITFGIKAIASQTGDLTQWQNSAGTVLAKVDANGSINAVGLSLNSTVSGVMFSVDPTYGNITSRNGAYGYSGSASLNIGTNYPAQPAIIASGYPGQSVPTIIIKSVTSQTSNLQEWQDSTGTVKSSITASGSLELNGKDIELMNIMGAF